MTTTSALLPLLVAFPLAGALILLLVGRRGDRWGHWLGVLAPAVSFVLAVVLFVQMIGADAEERHTSANLWDWVATANYHVAFELQLDQLSMCFVLLILGVGSLIHLYSVGYMAHDGRRRRFFAYLNLFVAAMLLLVLAGDYLLLFVGWEGVGLASYLLIGFWQHRPSAATAAKKAFVVNRVGDIGLSLGDHGDDLPVRQLELRRRARRRRTSSARPARRSSACCCSSAPAASRRSGRCRAGSWTRWRARRRCRRSSMRPRW